LLKEGDFLTGIPTFTSSYEELKRHTRKCERYKKRKFSICERWGGVPPQNSSVQFKKERWEFMNGGGGSRERKNFSGKGEGDTS